MLGRQTQRGLAIVGGQHVVVLGLQLGLQQADVGFDIVDDEDAAGHATLSAVGSR